MAFASCGGDDDEPVVDRGEAVVMESPAGYLYGYKNKSLLIPSTITISYYDNVKTADIAIDGFATASDGASYSLKDKIEVVPFKLLPDGTREIDADKIINGQYGDKYSDIESLVGKLPASELNPDGAEIFSFALTRNLDYTTYGLTFIPATSVMNGTTVITSGAAGSFTTTETSYLLSIKADGTADLTVRNAKFAQGMPAVGDMSFKGLDLTCSDDGFVATKESLIPSIAGVPYPTFAISKLRLEADLEGRGDADLTFECNAFGRNYTVVASDMTCLPQGSGR